MPTLGLASVKLLIQGDGIDIAFGGVKCQRGPIHLYCMTIPDGTQFLFSRRIVKRPLIAPDGDWP